MKGISIVPGQSASEAAFSIAMFALSFGITVAFGYYLITEPARLTEIWLWTRSLNIFIQLLIWLLFLPWMICLLIWVQPWPALVRWVLVVAALMWTNWLLFPWK